MFLYNFNYTDYLTFPGEFNCPKCNSQMVIRIDVVPEMMEKPESPDIDVGIPMCEDLDILQGGTPSSLQGAAAAEAIVEHQNFVTPQRSAASSLNEESFVRQMLGMTKSTPSKKKPFKEGN